MAGNTHAQYLESKILTASQPRLHLMLLEAAVRHCVTAAQAAAKEFWGEFDAALDKAMDIVEELVTSVCGKKEEVSIQFEEQYAFIFRELTECRFGLELEKLVSCTKLLEYERETWKLACENLENERPARPVVPAPYLSGGSVLAGEGFSLEG